MAEKLFTWVSSVVVVLFLGTVALWVIKPIEPSFAGTFGLVVGSAVAFSLVSVPLWFAGRRLMKRRPADSPRFVTAVMWGLTLPPACFVVGFVIAFFMLFRGR
jgi:hypothetical protein